MKKKSRGLEFIRFIICGIASALADYLICQLFVFIIGNRISHIWLTVISTFFGFVIGTIVNYLLSTFWVYQNVDKDIKTKSPRFITLFTVFSFCALALSIGTMLLCNLVVTKGIGFESIVELSIIDLIKQFGISFLAQGIFWAYFISFCIKTLVGLVFNYFTRKYILYKEPKEN
ncbi:MAG: GtrA family protein [Bacilli bacterium]|nr:GtrA family protein [Bacilli bacterium]